MAGATGIEFLSLLFTAGATVGTILSGHNMWALCAVLLPISALPCFFPRILINAGRRTSELVFGLSFLILGVVSAISRKPAQKSVCRFSQPFSPATEAS